ncbi:MAG: arylsulfatase [Bauldia sp.]|nr:arylsulfatase [Bauldia sp.]
MARNRTLLHILIAGVALSAATGLAVAQDADKPNILVLWGDDIGTWNISHNNHGMMGYRTPNIDRIADEGVSFTDYYGQQSCTAGRAAFIGGNVPIRTGMTKVGTPGSEQGWQDVDVTMATVLKSLGYATGQFGKNHQGDRDEHLPTMHGFDEFLGNLYHINAEEEPENRDYPRDLKLPNGQTFFEKYGPRGVLHTWANADGTQRIEDTGPLTRKRMETVDDETLAAAVDFIKRAHDDGKPFFVWWNATRMHLRTHVRPEHIGLSGETGDEYQDGMVEHDMQVGEFLDLLDEMGIADNTVVLYSTDNGPHFNTWPDAGTTPFRSEKNSNWEGAYRVPAFVRWPGHFLEGETLNGIVSHEDWLPTFAALAGNPDIKEQLLEGVDLNGRHYRNFIDGYDMTDYLEGKGDDPRKWFLYPDDEGEIVAARYGQWKVVFAENRGQGFGVWREPFVRLRMPLIFNLRRDPFELAQHNATEYDNWILAHAFVMGPISDIVAGFLGTLKDYPPSQIPGSWDIVAMQERLMNQIQSGMAAR